MVSMVMSGSKQIVSRILYTVLLAIFFIASNHKAISGDLDEQAWGTICGRVALCILFALIIAWRMREPIPMKTSRLRSESLLVILFVGILSYPLISQYSFLGKSVDHVFHHVWRRHSEQGKNTAWGLLNKFPAVFESYRKQHFNTPREYINIDSLIKVYGLRISPTRKVAMGKNGFFYEGFGSRKVEKGIIEQFDNISDYMGLIPFTDSELRQWKRTLEERRYWLKLKGSEFVFVLAPTKAFVYPEYLPAKLNRRKAVTRYEQLVEYLINETDIYFIDLLPALLKAKEQHQYPELFYRSDFHWNFFGSFFAYQEMVGKMEEFFPEQKLTPLALDSFELDINSHWYHKRFIHMLGLPPYLHTNEHYITMVPKPGNLLREVPAVPETGVQDVKAVKDKIFNTSGEALDIRLIKSPAAEAKAILLLGDSFLQKSELYFAANFQRVLSYRTIVNFPTHIFSFEQPEIVLQEILNMYILRKPPENSSGIKMAYLQQNYFDEKREKTVFYSKIFADQGKPLERIDKGGKLDLPEFTLAETDEIVICRLALENKSEAELFIQGQQQDAESVDLFKLRILPGSSEIFFEIPHARLEALFFIEDKDGNRLPKIKEFELVKVSD